MITDYQQLPAATSALAAGTEVAVIGNVLDSGAGGNYPQGRVIKVTLNVSMGSSATALSVKVRQGLTIAGTQVGVSQTPTIAASTG